MALRIILLAALLLQNAGTQVSSHTPASIEGIVVRAGTNEPIAGATVELTGIAPRLVEGSQNVGRGVISVNVLESESDGRVLSFTAITNTDGTFSIDNIPPTNNYQLIAIHSPDFLVAQYGQRVPAVPGRPIDLSAGQNLRGVRVEMTPAAKISGIVTDSVGRPVRNVRVELRRPWYLEGWRILSDWNQLIDRIRGIGKSNRAASVTTNSRGEFTFAGLAPSQYYIRTNFTDETTAEPIDLHAGAAILDVRIVTPDSGQRTISGTIFDANGVLASVAQVAVLRSNSVPLYSNSAIDAHTLRRQSQGQFRLDVPGPGKYVLVGIGEGRSPARAWKEVEVGNIDLSNVQLQLIPPFPLSGTVTVEALPRGRTPTMEPVDVNLYPLTPAIATATSRLLPSGNGAFTLENATVGRFRIEVSPILMTPPNAFVPASIERAYVKSIRMDGRDVLNAGLQLESPTGGILQIVISMNGGTLTGRVLDTTRKPVNNAKVVLVPNAPRRSRGDLFKSVSTDDAGRFQLNGLAPGDYKLFAWERVEEGAWQDPQFLRLFENLGSPLRIEEGKQATADAKLIPAWN